MVLIKIVCIPSTMFVMAFQYANGYAEKNNRLFAEKKDSSRKKKINKVESVGKPEPRIFFFGLIGIKIRSRSGRISFFSDVGTFLIIAVSFFVWDCL